MSQLQAICVQATVTDMNGPSLVGPNLTKLTRVPGLSMLQAIARGAFLPASRAAKLEALRKAVEVGLAELDRGEGHSAEDVFKDLLDRLGRSEAA